MGNSVWIALGITTLAGLATGVGSATVLVARRENLSFLSLMLGFSAGVMIFVSLVEIYGKAQTAVENDWLAMGAFFGGIILIATIDRLIPKKDNPHELKKGEEISQKKNQALLRSGVLTALAVGIHNFPEGLATFVASLQEPALAIPIVFAIAIHNIPEGIAVALPIFYATQNRKKAFLFSFLSGLSEPIGALIGLLLLAPLMSQTAMGITFGMVTGIMIFVSLDELLPLARAYGDHHLSIYGMVGGMLIMAISLALF